MLFSSAMLAAYAYIAVGIVLIVRPDIAPATLIYIAVGIFLLIGVIDVIHYVVKGVAEARVNNYLAVGLVLILLAIMGYIHAGDLIAALPALLGIALMIDGILKLQRSVDLARLKFDGWVFVLILAALSIVIGLIMISKMDSLDTGEQNLTVMLGVAFVFCGVTSVIVTIMVHHRLQRYHREEAIKVEDVTGPVQTVPDIPAASAAAEGPYVPPAQTYGLNADQNAPAGPDAPAGTTLYEPQPGVAQVPQGVIEPAPAEQEKTVDASWVDVSQVPYENVDLSRHEDSSAESGQNP